MLIKLQARTLRARAAKRADVTEAKNPVHRSASPSSSGAQPTIREDRRSALRRSVNDLLSESNDGRPSFHRFQMIGWNLAFGIIFVRAVYYKLAMPEFSSDQLLLMNLSNEDLFGVQVVHR